MPLVLLVAIAQAVGLYVKLPPFEQQPRNPIGVPMPSTPRAVYLVPIGSVPETETTALVAHYRQKFGLPITALPAIEVAGGAYDEKRRQLVAERLIEALGRTPTASQDPQAILIGLTMQDMYIADRLDWSYAFSLRSGGRFAVISTSRMSGGEFTNEDRRMRRIQKMITKNLGVLYYRLPQSDDPGSVLFRNILGPDDLDRASEAF
jgi:predicted Zn-dependent protease